ncbi:hypothetical protein D3C84_969820 [compost metagenome]
MVGLQRIAESDEEENDALVTEGMAIDGEQVEGAETAPDAGAADDAGSSEEGVADDE